MGSGGVAPGRFACVEMTASSAPRLQRFFEENPGYFVAVNGAPPGPREAAEELSGAPPKEFAFEKVWKLAFEDAGEMVGMADVVSHMLARDVWHIGLFIVATRLHGTGAALEMYGQLEAWIRSSGARWIRLGVVAGNARAERFWEKAGYVEVRRRNGVAMGRRTNDLRVMVKPLAGATIPAYLALVARDRPE